MENPIKSTPKDVFLHLFNIVTFYLTVVGFITLYIQYINAAFPDTLNYYFTAIANGVRWSSSILFVSVPAYIFTAWLLGRDIKKTPEKKELKLRKWLTYFTLFISAITIIVDLMIFVYNFLDGELTVRFFLKVLVVLLVAGAVFGYYMWELRRTNLLSKIPRVLAIALSVTVLSSIIIGFFIVGTPAEQRRRRMDDQRLSDLQIIQNEVINYWINKKTLPENLKNLENNISGFAIPEDPGTREPYEYNILAPLEFELCAEFAVANDNIDKKNEARPATFYGQGYYQQNWQHADGRVCFSRIIDPDLYKDAALTKEQAEKMMR